MLFRSQADSGSAPLRLSELRFQVAVGRSAVTMRFGDVDAYQIELPVTDTASIAGRQSDTIFSGIVYLWKDGSYPLAAIVFIASIIVPVTKLLLLSLLLISLQRHDRRWAERRLKAYRVLEQIGRWSMLDIFVVTMLAALVQVESLAELQPGPGAMAFGAVVVLTMLATHSFDPRLLFDKPEGEVVPMPQQLPDPAGEAP